MCFLCNKNFNFWENIWTRYKIFEHEFGIVKRFPQIYWLFFLDVDSKSLGRYHKTMFNKKAVLNHTLFLNYTDHNIYSKKNFSWTPYKLIFNSTTTCLTTICNVYRILLKRNDYPQLPVLITLHYYIRLNILFPCLFFIPQVYVYLHFLKDVKSLVMQTNYLIDYTELVLSHY